MAPMTDEEFKQMLDEMYGRQNGSMLPISNREEKNLAADLDTTADRDHFSPPAISLWSMIMNALGKQRRDEYLRVKEQRRSRALTVVPPVVVPQITSSSVVSAITTQSSTIDHWRVSEARPLGDCRPVDEIAPTPIRDRLWDNLPLHFVAFGLFATGAVINAYYTYSQGADKLSAYALMAVGVFADIATYSLPDRAAVRWRQRHYGTSTLAWILCIPLVAFVFLNTTGFTAINVIDTARERASITTPALEEAKKNLEDAKLARNQACTGRDGKPSIGPVCSKTTDEVTTQQRRHDDERDRIAADANPQSAKTAALIRWASFGYLAPSVADIANLTLLLFAALPLSGGLIRMIARRR